MRLTPPALLRMLDPLLIHSECQELIYRISVHCAAKSKSAKELLLLQTHHDVDSNQQLQHQQQQTIQDNNQSNCFILPTAMSKLDLALRGGIRSNTITEIVGQAGIGKTQLVTQLVVNACALSMGTIYIDTKKKNSVYNV